MATIKSEYYRFNGVSWDIHYFKTTMDMVDGLNTALAGKQDALTNPVVGSSYPGAYSPVAGDFMYYGGYGWQTNNLAELQNFMSFEFMSGLIATISSNTTTSVSGLSSYKWLLVEMVAAGVRETRTVRYVAGQAVQISAYIAGTWRYITLTTNASSIVSTGISGSPTVYVYGVK